MLNVLAEADATRMRADGHAELGRHEHHGEILVDAAEAAAVDLTDPDGFRLQQLFEQHPIREMLAGRHANGSGSPRNGGMAEDVIGERGFFHPPDVVPGECLDALDSFFDLPPLIRIDHQAAVWSDFLTHQPYPPRIVSGWAPAFTLKWGHPGA